MSVHTPLSESDINSLLSAQGLPALAEYKGVLGGMENTNYFLELSDQQGLVCTLFELRSEAQVQQLLPYLKLLQAAGLPVPNPIGGEQAIMQLKQKPVVLVPRFAGEHVERCSVAQASALGEMVALMHKASAQIDMAKWQQFTTHRNEWLEEQQVFLHLVQESEQGTELRQKVQSTFMQYELALASDPALSQAIIHSDLFRDNVLFDGDTPSALLDFYDAVYDYVIYDLAIIFNDWFHLSALELGDERAELEDDEYGKVLWPQAKAFFAAYQQKRSISDDEKAFFALAVQAAAARFYAWRLDAKARRVATTSEQQVLVKDPEQYKLRYLNALMLDDFLQEVFCN